MDISSIRSCRIHPAIGIARVGASPDGYFIGPEIPCRPGRPRIASTGSRTSKGCCCARPLDSRVYGYNADGKVVAELTAANAAIEWRVHVANHKAAWYDFDEAMDIPSFSGSGGTTPQSSARRNKDVTGPSRQQLVIDPGPRTISGTNVSGKKYQTRWWEFLRKPGLARRGADR